MYESIFYKIGRKTIEVGGESFSLGKLTAEVLNITPQEHEKMLSLLEQAEENLTRYTDTLDLPHWKSANDSYLKLDAMLCTRSIFRLMKQKPSVLEEAQTLFDDLEELKIHDFELTEEDYKILNAMNLYEEYLQNPNAFGGETLWEATDVRTGECYQYSRPQPPIPAPPPPKTKNLLIAPGDLELKLAVYKRVCAGYRNALDDIASFNMTIEDLISEGNLALLEVIVGNSYDPTKGKLMTYALPFIKGSMCRWLEKHLGTMSVSKHQMEKIRRVQQMYYEYNYDAGTIARDLKISPEETAQLLLYNTHPISLDDLKAVLAYAEDNSENDNVMLMPAAENVEHTVMNEIWLSLLPEVFHSLKVKDRYILGHYYGLYDYEKKSLEQLGLELELTVDGVYKARDAALRRLKQLYYGTPLHIWRRAYVDTKLAALKGL